MDPYDSVEFCRELPENQEFVIFPMTFGKYRLCRRRKASLCYDDAW